MQGTAPHGNAKTVWPHGLQLTPSAALFEHPVHTPYGLRPRAWDMRGSSPHQSMCGAADALGSPVRLPSCHCQGPICCHGRHQHRPPPPPPPPPAPPTHSAPIRPEDARTQHQCYANFGNSTASRRVGDTSGNPAGPPSSEQLGLRSFSLRRALPARPSMLRPAVRGVPLRPRPEQQTQNPTRADPSGTWRTFATAPLD